MLQNLFTGSNLLADLSVDRTPDHLQKFGPCVAPPFSKLNLDRCASAGRGMLRLIWSHPEFPTKEDIRDELRRSEIREI